MERVFMYKKGRAIKEKGKRRPLCVCVCVCVYFRDWLQGLWKREIPEPKVGNLETQERS